MNERIRELARQATRQYSPTYYRQEWIQCLAQLIVRECLEACSRANEIRHFVPPTQEQVVLSCIDEIERTFRS